MRIEDVISILVMLVNIILGLFVLLKYPKKRLHQAFFLFTLSVSFWLLASWQAGIVREGLGPPLIWEKLSFAAGALIAPALVYFAYVFVGKKQSFVFKIIALILIPIFFVVATLTPYVVNKVERAVLGYEATYGLLWYFYAIYFILYILTSFVVIIFKYKNAAAILQLKIKYLLIGLILSALIAVAANLIIPFFISINILQNNSVFQFFFHFGHLATIFFIGFTAYAILRYRLMDIKVVIRKGLIYTFSLIIALAFYTYLAILGKNFLQNTLNLPENWGIFVLILLVALGFPPLKYGVEKLITTAFFSKVKNLKKKAREIAQDISSKIKLEELVNQFADEVKENISVNHLQVYLKNRKTGDFNAVYPAGFSDLIKYEHPLTNYFKVNQEILITEEIEYMKENENEAKVKLLENLKKELETRDVALVIPLQNLSEELDVLIFLENKKNKEAFNIEDVSFLQNIAGQFNIALANAILYKEALERINYQ